MKIRTLLAALVTMIVLFGTGCGPAVLTVSAQTLPITITIGWDANDPSEGVVAYIVAIDGTVINGDSPFRLSEPVTLTSAGSHTITVVARNAWGTSPPATLVVNVVLPKAPANLRRQP